MERKVLWKAARVSVLSVPLFLIIDGRLSSQWMLLVYGMSRVMERKNTVAPNPTNKFAGGERHIVRMPWNSIWGDTWLAPHWAGSCVQWWTNCLFSPSLPPSHPLLKKKKINLNLGTVFSHMEGSSQTWLAQMVWVLSPSTQSAGSWVSAQTTELCQVWARRARVWICSPGAYYSQPLSIFGFIPLKFCKILSLFIQLEKKKFCSPDLVFRKRLYWLSFQ